MVTERERGRERERERGRGERDSERERLMEVDRYRDGRRTNEMVGQPRTCIRTYIKTRAQLLSTVEYRGV
jgi:hypothetical protein